MPQFEHIGVIVKPPAEQHAALLDQLAGVLARHGAELLLDETGAPWGQRRDLPCLDRATLAARADLVVVVGGDGSFLNAARTLVDHDLPLLGINQGRLGFLVDVSPEDMPVQLGAVLAGDYTEERRSMLSGCILRGGNCIHSSYALNDVTLHVRDVVRMIEFETLVNGQFVNTQRADGLVIATPTGSTAYALSGGGPILHPGLEALSLVPICPHTLSNRPIVVADDSRIVVRLCRENRNHAQVAFDGQDNFDLLPEDEIHVARHEHDLRLIHPPGHDYFHVLRAKLRWGEQP